MRFLSNYSSTASTSYFDSSTESMCIQKSTQQKVPKRLSGHHCITDCPDKQNSPSDPFLLFPPRPLQTLIFPPPPPPRRWVGRGLFLFFVFLLSDDFQPYCRSLNFSKEDERASFLPLSPLHLPTYVSRLVSSAPGFISHTHSLVLSERRPSSPSSFFSEAGPRGAATAEEEEKEASSPPPPPLPDSAPHTQHVRFPFF